MTRQDRAAERARDLDEEIRLHIELRTEQLIAQGWDAASARREAERRFGPPREARRSLYRAALRRDRRARVRAWADALRHDVRLSLRTLRRERTFAAVVILTMALGIGANAAMFGVLDRLLVRGPDHVTEPDRVVNVYAVTMHPQFGEIRSSQFGWVTYAALRDGATGGLEGVAAYRVTDAFLGEGADAEPVRLGAATRDYFPLLGVRAVLGRFPSADEDAPPEGAAVVVVSHTLWQRRFGGARDVIGREVRVRGEPFTVIGVAPRGFTGTELGRVDAWIPMARESREIRPDWPTTWRAQWLRVVGRLAPGVSAAAAQEEATRAWRALRAEDPGTRESEAVLGLSSLAAGAAGREPLETSVARWLVGVAAVVLLIACANVMNLLLARGARRRRETAVRVALGIGRGRLAGLLLTEALLLVLLGGIAALLFASWGGTLIRTVLLPGVEWTTSPVDGRVLLFTIVVTAAAGLLTGIVPALRTARGTAPAAALRTGVREGGGRRSRLRGALSVVQAALSVVLLVGAGLFVRSLDNALDVELGFDADGVLAGWVQWPPLPAADASGAAFGGQHVGTAARSAAREARRAFYGRALEALRAHPAVEHAAISVGTPFHTTFGVGLRVPGRDTVPEMPGGGPYIAAVSPGYFETVGTRVVRGRGFLDGEGAGTEPVTVVNETMARVLWPGEEAIGRCLLIGDEAEVPCARIVGVVEDAHRFALREDEAMQYYIPLGQERGFGGPILMLRPRGDRDAAIPPIRAVMQRLDPAGGYVELGTLRQQLDPQIRPWRLGSLLFGLFGMLALVIAAVGMYSVIAYGVSQRTHEMGVRMVLGARRADVRLMVLRQATRVALAGILLGVLAALAAGRLAEALLFDVSFADPLVLCGVSLVLMGAALLASWIPALRATRVDPVVALRAD